MIAPPTPPHPHPPPTHLVASPLLPVQEEGVDGDVILRVGREGEAWIWGDEAESGVKRGGVEAGRGG